MILTPSLARLSVRRRCGGPRPFLRTAGNGSPLLIRSSLPFSSDKAPFYREAEAAVDVVERACRLCIDVKRSLLSNDDGIIEKKDRTPVTIADFGVQALISLELERLFPLIPLVAEEDSSFLRSGSVSAHGEDGVIGNFLVDSVVSAVANNTSNNHELLTADDILEAIDRGEKDAVPFGVDPATYWVLDPIDGTRGFLKGSDALYVVGLALVVEGKIVLGVMGCPNWKWNMLPSEDCNNETSGKGIVMVAHVCCGTWERRLLKDCGNFLRIEYPWNRCYVDNCHLVHTASFCIPDSQTWDTMPLSEVYCSTLDSSDSKDEKKILLVPTCCGSLCKYMMVASGRASTFILRARVQTLIKVWDHAVGVICVKEAGGEVTDWTGSPLDLAADQTERRLIFPSGGVLVSNGNLHEQIVQMISTISKA